MAAKEAQMQSIFWEAADPGFMRPSGGMEAYRMVLCLLGTLNYGHLASSNGIA